MAKVTIVGAGHSGLQLGIGLVEDGHDVRVISNRTPEQVRSGRVMSSQFMFASALDTERELGLDFWADTCPAVEGIAVSIPHPEIHGAKAIHFASRLDRIGHSVDQRVKFPRWMEHFSSKGGRLEIHEATVADLERYAAEDDLVIVAAGKGEIGRLFERDAAHSPFDQPMRAIMVAYVTGALPYPEYSTIGYNICPGIGEAFTIPALTTTGPCEILILEGVPGGPLDCWENVATPAAHLEQAQRLLETFFPWEAARYRAVELTDPNGIFTGRFAPVVRKPVLKLPSGRSVLGMGDVVVLVDPITGQGSNNAAKCATSYRRAIRERGAAPFDAAWMQATFDKFFEYAQAVSDWTNMLLTPPPPHVLQLFMAACTEQRIAHRFMNAFDDPRDYREWFMDPAKAQAYLGSMAAPA